MFQIWEGEIVGLLLDYVGWYPAQIASNSHIHILEVLTNLSKDCFQYFVHWILLHHQSQRFITLNFSQRFLMKFDHRTILCLRKLLQSVIHCSLNISFSLSDSINLISQSNDFRVLYSLSLFDGSSRSLGIFCFHLLNDKDDNIVDLLYFVKSLL